MHQNKNKKGGTSSQMISGSPFQVVYAECFCSYAQLLLNLLIRDAASATPIARTANDPGSGTTSAT